MIHEGPLRELVLQALETERVNVEVYETAVQCAVRPDLRREWQQFLAETREHVDRALELCEALGLDPEAQTAGRAVVRHIGASLVEAMRQARRAGERAAAERVACECVVHAETKGHLNWELLQELARHTRGPARAALAAAADEIQEEVEEHLQHTRGWTRELWLAALGVPAVLPPPEESRLASAPLSRALPAQGPH